ncbi:glycosyltransferase [Streptacidiphilus sp. 4-A2]|nr:glycosyltransferase [Streptacidiphilus sp. 4-A2]
MAPRLSVVVPIYNVRLYLDECLSSIAAQTLTDLEVVMVDDGSTDDSAEIAERFAAKDSRFRLVKQENKGLGPARNTGIRNIDPDSEYLAFVDSDDTMPPTAYQLMVETLDSTGSDFVSGNVLRFRSVGYVQSPVHRRPFAETALRTHITERPLLVTDRTAWNKVYRRSFWDAQGLEYPGILYEDAPVSVPLHFLAKRVDILSEPIYHWREREVGARSITQNRTDPKGLIDRVTSMRLVREFLKAQSGAEYAKHLRFYNENSLVEEVPLFFSRRCRGRRGVPAGVPGAHRGDDLRDRQGHPERAPRADAAEVLAHRQAPASGAAGAAGLRPRVPVDHPGPGHGPELRRLPLAQGPRAGPGERAAARQGDRGPHRPPGGRLAGRQAAPQGLRLPEAHRRRAAQRRDQGADAARAGQPPQPGAARPHRAHPSSPPTPATSRCGTWTGPASRSTWTRPGSSSAASGGTASGGSPSASSAAAVRAAAGSRAPSGSGQFPSPTWVSPDVRVIPQIRTSTCTSRWRPSRRGWTGRSRPAATAVWSPCTVGSTRRWPPRAPCCGCTTRRPAPARCWTSRWCWRPRQGGLVPFSVVIDAARINEIREREGRLRPSSLERPTDRWSSELVPPSGEPLDIAVDDHKDASAVQLAIAAEPGSAPPRST